MKNKNPPTMKSLLDKKKYELAYKMAKNENKINELINLMSTNHHCNHAYSILKAENLSFFDYPELQTRAMKKYVRYLQKTFNWEQIELRLLSSKKLMTYFAEDIFYNHGSPNQELKDIALSLVNKYQLTSLVEKSELKSAIGQDFKMIDNIYLTQDNFSILTSSIRFHQK